MPCDIIYDRHNQNVYESILNEISRICQEDNSSYIIVGGDFNTDFARNNSLHTQALTNFIDFENLFNGLAHTTSHVEYTYESKSTGIRSTLDHFLVSHALYYKIFSYIPLHEGDNLSDHAPLFSRCLCKRNTVTLTSNQLLLNE